MLGPWQDRIEQLLGVRRTSGDRSIAAQDALYRRGVTPLRGGQSSHNRPDHAIDLPPVMSAAAANRLAREAGIPASFILETGRGRNQGTGRHLHGTRTSGIRRQIANLPNLERARNFNVDIPEETGMGYGTELTKLAAPTPGEGPSKPIAASDAPQPEPRRRRRGVLGFLESVINPDPASWWAGALRDGIWEAGSSQENYIAQRDQAKQRARMGDLEYQQADIALRNLMENGTTRVAGNNIIRERPGAEPEVITPPTEVERLIELWRGTQDPQERELIERAMRGFQYSPEYLAEQARQRAAVAEATARARAANPPPARPSTRAQTYNPPSGFVIRGQ